MDALAINSLPYQSIVETRAATTTAEDPAVTCGNHSTARSVWYTLVAGMGGTLSVRAASNYSAIMSIYTGSPGAFAAVACTAETRDLRYPGALTSKCL